MEQPSSRGAVLAATGLGRVVAAVAVAVVVLSLVALCARAQRRAWRQPKRRSTCRWGGSTHVMDK